MFLIIWRANPCASKGKIIPGDIFKQNAWLWQLIISRVLPSRHNLNFELTTKSIGGGVPGFLRVFKLCKKLWYVCQKKPPINLVFGIKGDSFFFTPTAAVRGPGRLSSAFRQWSRLTWHKVAQRSDWRAGPLRLPRRGLSWQHLPLHAPQTAISHSRARRHVTAWHGADNLIDWLRERWRDF